MTLRERKIQQERFFKLCVQSCQTLDEILSDMKVPPETLAGWLTDRRFRIRLHAMQRYLKRTRELHVTIGAARAAAVLTRVVRDVLPKEATPVQRSACVDLIRLARDSRARARVANASVDDLTKRRDLYHPAIATEEADALMEALSQKEATTPK